MGATNYSPLFLLVASFYQKKQKNQKFLKPLPQSRVGCRLLCPQKLKMEEL